MKRNKIILIVTITLALIAVLVLINKSSVNTLDRYTDFAVTDTGNITKIFLADKKNNSVLLEKKSPGQWIVNKKYQAALAPVNSILKTIACLEVKNPVPKTAHNNIVRLMSKSSTKVEIYKKVYFIDILSVRLFSYEKCVKTYYVGLDTQDNLGTYMLIEGGDTPYVLHIPGFNGFLSSRYSVLEKDWRDHSVFDLKYSDIKSVTMQFIQSPEKSFRLEKDFQNNYKLIQLHDLNSSDGNVISVFDTLKVMDYFSYFADVRYESIVDFYSKEKIDSIKNTQPHQILSVEDINGNTVKIKTYNKKAIPGQLDLNGNPVLWDRDRLYALINNDQDFVVIQYFVFDRILRSVDFFIE